MLGLLLLSAVAVGSGCSDAQMNRLVVKLFEPKRTPQQNMVLAFASEDADVRRGALAKVAQSKEADRDWAIKGYIAVALLDIEPQARCVAIRALARTGDPRAVETMLKLLNHREYAGELVQPPGTLCRWDATAALADLSAEGKVPEEQKEKVRGTLLERLRNDRDWHVRVAAARGLGHYPTEETVQALVGRLYDQVFAVVYQCEESLVQLTGRTHGCSAPAWEDWLEANRGDLFAHAGEIPESRRLPYRNRFEKAGHDFKRFVRWLVPASKE